jgi:hypothetical protein
MPAKERRPQGSTMSPAVQEELTDFFEKHPNAGGSAAEMHLRQVQREGGLQDEEIRYHRNTLGNFKRDLQFEDPSGPWKVWGSQSPEETALVLDTLAEVILISNGKQRTISQLQARYIVNIRQAAPTLNGWTAYRYAREYLRRRERREPTEDMDMAIASVAQEPMTLVESVLPSIAAKLDNLISLAGGQKALTEDDLLLRTERYRGSYPLADTMGRYLILRGQLGVKPPPDEGRLPKPITDSDIVKRKQQGAEQELDVALQKLSTPVGTQAAEQRLDAALDKLNEMGTTQAVIEELDQALAALNESELTD